MSSEFIDAYSDDQTYLEELEELVNSNQVVPDNIRYSSLSRLWSVMIVGSVESMIKEWTKNEPLLSDIYAYFDKGSNADRIDRLKKAFQLRGIEIDTELLEQYLSIKYIRNAYVHGQWDEKQKLFVIEQGFPESLMEFEQHHFAKIKASYYHVMNCLGITKGLDSVIKSRSNK